MNIFLADDDPDDCTLFEDALQIITPSYVLTTAFDGQELMETLQEKVPPPPDLIFLDLNMPRKTGVDCLKEIRTNQKLKSIPVIILSTSSQTQYIEETYKLGANRYIQKPNSFAELKTAISSVLAIDWTTNFEQPPRNHFFVSC